MAIDKAKVVEFETDNGSVRLTPEIVKRYLVSGDADKVTDQEIMMFLALCKYQRLNPFLREAYLIKYGNEPATIVTGKDLFTKRAARNELCSGWQAGVIIRKKDGSLEYRNGTLVLDNEELVGGWAKVYRKDWKEPLEISVSLREYERKRKDGTLQRNWREMPATMIRKVALVQALREAFSETFQGMYAAEEMGVASSSDEEVIDIETTPTQELATEAQRKKIYTLAAKLGFSKEQMHTLMYERYGKSSSKELTKNEASDLIDYLEAQNTEVNEENQNEEEGEER